MSATAHPSAGPAGSVDPQQLTIHYTSNDDGWVTAQIEEFPAAISQGATRHEAWVNVLDALHDLTHEPTLTERVAFTVEARLVDLKEAVAELAEARDRLIADAVERGRAAAERSRTSVH